MIVFYCKCLVFTCTSDLEVYTKIYSVVGYCFNMNFTFLKLKYTTHETLCTPVAAYQNPSLCLFRMLIQNCVHICLVSFVGL